MKKAALFVLFLAGCSMKTPPVDPVKPVDPNPNHLPADILKLHPKSYQLGTVPNVCDNIHNSCKRGVDGYLRESEFNDMCYCVRQKCVAGVNGALEKCTDLVPR